LKKHLPAVIILTTLLLALPAGIFVSQMFAAHAATSKQSAPHTSSLPTMSFTDVCEAPANGQMSCMAMMSTTTVQPKFADWAPVTTPGDVAPAAIPTGSAAPYGPAALHNAYNLPTTMVAKQTVAIVDAFDNPNAETDLATYRSMFGLPACTTANGCFRKVNQTGGTTYPVPNTAWAGEISLDLDMVSAICPGCNILLVEANSPTTADLGTAVNEAVALGANEVSNSYGAPASARDAANCNSFYNHPGVVITASSGDTGPGILTPANCPNVVSVGGTTLNANGTETAWNTSPVRGAGGGCSAAQIPAPIWEVPATTNCATRAVTDVSAVADPQTGVLVINTFGQKGFMQVGGTSVSAPIIAATYALAGGVSNMTSAASIPWTKISAGTQCLNTVGGAYSFQTGLGSPNGTGCFSAA
jgi:subtilase family serine protease